MVPPPVGRVALDSVRKVPGGVRLRNGHMARDCWRRDSIGMCVVLYVVSSGFFLYVCMYMCMC